MSRGPRPTRAGRLLLAASAGAALAARLLGLVELDVLAAAGVLVVGLALLRVQLLRPRLEVRRSVRPSRVHVGSRAAVEVEVTSAGRRATPVLTLRDPVGGRAGARLSVAPLAPGHSVRATYRLPTHQRGEVPVGPLLAEVSDPFGLARRGRPVAGRVRLLVLPRVDRIPPLGRTPGSEPLAGQDGRPSAGGAGDEFHALRPYVVGDDLRRVHWPMSARADDLVVRHDEEPRQGRLTLVLDVEERRSRPDGFERMVSAAASIATAHWRRGDIVRLLDTGGGDSGWVTGEVAFEQLLEALALVERTDDADLRATLGRIPSAADAVVAVAGNVTDPEVGLLPGRRLARAGAPLHLTLVRFPATRSLTSQAGAVVAGVRVVNVAPRGDFAASWAEAGPARRGAPVGSRA
ncbi:DUF58 domain-containing protein [Iamia majanohamensis]|uniref:DUF58 domain-containing protein n=1 Tax=Iamia majanohamensis TaxID=467976 RepID=A0AAF0BSG8_9ACTN|nr:DUF58 domain-containing protein [Iamia majanohamensis]WCO65242.1 DUF58 domain-containing protein [Iamia majanohamensis]